MIRSAKKSDVDQIVPLVMIILKDMELVFLKKYGEEKLVEVLKLAFADENFRFGYARGIVLEEENEILGVAFGYLDSEESTIDEPLKAAYRKLGIPEDEVMFGDKEAFENEWYLDSIAVRADQRGRGIGAKLLEALPKFATKQGANKIGLSVDDVNPRAKQLYIRQGFKEVGRAVISGHQYDHMQKEI
ncbi:GNAT family N-acetyltransferase [Vagococcus sp. BWB3-3]|uniref:GNAT family N-acetyltransferase n=1 Tax=Vagococcus allomyrinae TaxID=2794353 RepID=A0A940PI40_9ENTE|nr:GNAT family N-acetyltransferase [Vagococcus allomyrinae]MBP1044001.1 GNAT family N-acetyltransferase [Vagococcus allomyrinae]